MADKYREHKLDVLARLQEGETAKEIAADIRVPYQKILIWKKELDEGKISKDIDVVTSAPENVLARVAKTVSTELEALEPGSGELVEEILEGAKGLEALQDDTQKAAKDIVEVIRAKATLVDVNAIELETLVDSLVKIQNAFFARDPQVNAVLLGNPSNSSLSRFSDLGRKA